MIEFYKSKYGKKAESLFKLSRIPEIVVPKFVVISPNQLDDEIKKTVNNFFENHTNISKVAVRSSGALEDLDDNSFAGFYQTFLDVDADIEVVYAFIIAVRNQAREKLRSQLGITSEMSVIVQEMVDADFSGVIFSRDFKHPDYILINQVEGKGENLVSGKESGSKKYFLRGLIPEDSLYAEILNATNAIERDYEQSKLDIEFAVKNGQLYILQCRPITTKIIERTDCEERLLARYARLAQLKIKENIGQEVLTGMSDINPRELLGSNPKPLNVSIFRKIFADSVVEEVRSNMGYSPSFQGLVDMVGQNPYVKVSVVANSFRPAKLQEDIYKKIVAYYLKKLKNNPELQDKVEFDLIAMRPGKLLDEVLKSIDLTNEEAEKVVNSFSQVQINIETYANSIKEKYYIFLNQYEQRIKSLKQIEDQSLEEIMDLIIEGTKMFVIVARLAFYFQQKVGEAYNQSLSEIAAQGPDFDTLPQNLLRFINKEIDLEDLKSIYGHLRPGQFDLFTPAYDSNIEFYLNLRNLNEKNINQKIKDMELKKRQYLESLEDLENQQRYDVELLSFFLKAREEVKFHFMRPYHILSKKILSMASSKNIDEEVLAELSFKELLTLQNSGHLPLNLNRRKRGRDFKKRLVTPELISLETPISQFECRKQGNYITELGEVRGDVMYLAKIDNGDLDLQGKIVVLECADPGFDYILRMGIAGIITRHGGPLSHIAIRCREMNIPACLGYGDIDSLLEKQVILDCQNQKIVIL
jgi:glutamine kinase